MNAYILRLYREIKELMDTYQVSSLEEVQSLSPDLARKIKGLPTTALIALENRLYQNY